MRFEKWTSPDTVKNLTIDLVLGNTCNFKCTYCNPWSYSGSEPWLQADPVIRLADAIKQKMPWKHSRVYNLLGGEPSLMPRLDDMLAGIKAVDPDAKIILTTNGSRTERYWQHLSQYVDRCVFSVHLAQADLEQVARNMRACVEQGTWVVANVLMDIEHWQLGVDTCEHWVLTAYAHRIYAKPVKKTLRLPDLQDYSAEQIDWLATWQHQRLSEERCRTLVPEPRWFDEDQYGIYDDESQTWPYGGGHDHMIALNLNRFSGWQCWIGIDSMLIDVMGRVKGGSACDLGHEYGNFLQSDPFTWDWTPKPVICTYDACGCGNDLCARKFKDPVQSQLALSDLNTI